MSNQSSTQRQIEQHLQLWIYLLPIVGVFPAVWTLYQAKNNDFQHMTALRQKQKASRLSINLIIIWLSSYALSSLGSANASEIISFRLLYANAVITTGYFVTCTWLMSRLGKEKLFLPEKID